MPAIHVRNLDDAVIAALKARAARNRRSLQGEVRNILEAASGAEDRGASSPPAQAPHGPHRGSARFVFARLDLRLKPPESCSSSANVLLEGTVETRAAHTVVRQLVESRSRLVVSAQVIREYLVVATRSVDSNGLGLARGQALDNVGEFRKRVRLVPEEKEVVLHGALTYSLRA